MAVPLIGIGLTMASSSPLLHRGLPFLGLSPAIRLKIERGLEADVIGRDHRRDRRIAPGRPRRSGGDWRAAIDEAWPGHSSTSGRTLPHAVRRGLPASRLMDVHRHRMNSRPGQDRRGIELCSCGSTAMPRRRSQAPARGGDGRDTP